MRRPTIMKRGKNLMGKGTEATLSFQTLADILGRDVPAEIDPDRRTLVTELTIRKSALNVRLRKGDQITISVPLGKRDCSRASLYAFNRICIKEGCDNWGVRFHEYGHWFFATAYDFLDEAWEVLWWHFRVRQLFVNPRAWWLNMFQRPADAHRVMILEPEKEHRK